MTKEQFNVLTKPDDLIIREHMYGTKDRTLLYGYTCDRETFHVYQKDYKIHVVIYKTKHSESDGVIKEIPVNMREVQIKSNYDYVPDKRLYPETCDYLFSQRLKERGINLPFTFYNEDRPKQKFYGFTLDDYVQEIDKDGRYDAERTD